MKALVFSDAQADDTHERLFSNPTVSLQRWRTERMFAALMDVYKNEKCSCVWELGDLTDDRNSLTLPTIHTVVSGMNQFPKSPYNIKIVGNHEQYLKNAEIHHCQIFSSNFTVVDTVKTFDLGSALIAVAAYPSDEGELTEWIRKVIRECRQAEKPVIFLGHFQVLGCELNSGQSLTGIPKKALAGVELGLLGHVHKHQKLAPNVFYVGSPFQQNFGEAHEEKMVAVVDTETCSVKWIKLLGFPEYRTVSFQDFVKLVRPDSEDRYKVVLRSPAESEQFYAHPLASRVTEPIYDYQATGPESSVEQVRSEAQWSLESVLKRYVDRVDPKSRNVLLSPEEMLDYGTQIAEAATD